MRIYRYETATGPQLGVGSGNLIINAGWLFEQGGQQPPDVVLQADIRTICAAPDVVIVFLRQFLESVPLPQEPDGVNAIAMGSAKLLPPIPNPGKFICIGLNYQDHCEEQNKPAPAYPILFGKYSNAICGHQDNVIKSTVTEQLDFEGELAVIIGEGGKRIPRERALQHVFGYTIVNDISARDVQKSDGQFLRAKTQDTFAPMGPCVLTADEVPNPQALDIRTTVNGAIMQNSNTRNMIFPVSHLISFISEGITLSPGDIISTGTPAGVGVHRKPPVLLEPGDVVEIEIPPIGTLRNPITRA